MKQLLNGSVGIGKDQACNLIVFLPSLALERNKRLYKLLFLVRQYIQCILRGGEIEDEKVPVSVARSVCWNEIEMDLKDFTLTSETIWSEDVQTYLLDWTSPACH